MKNKANTCKECIAIKKEIDAGRKKVISILVRSGANINALDNDGYTPLDAKSRVESVFRGPGTSFLESNRLFEP